MENSSKLLPASPVNPENAAFFAATSEGRFIGRRCCRCERFHWYPRAYCPFCEGETEWMPLSGKGEIYSFSTTGKSPDNYTIAYVTLEEGPTMLTNLTEFGEMEPSIGQKVTVVMVEAAEGYKVPCFKPLVT